MSARLDLDRYQRSLVAALVEGGDGAAVLERLRADPTLSPFADYLARCEPRCLDVAIDLVRTWGRREA